MSTHNSPKIKGPFGSLSKEKRTIEVTAALIKHGGEYLITQRHPHSHLGLYWEFPGGKREKEESLESCLVREIWEELGVRILVGSRFKNLVFEYSDRNVILYFYQCHMIEGKPFRKDCHDFKWIRPQDMDETSFPPADVEIIRMLKTAERS